MERLYSYFIPVLLRGNDFEDVIEDFMDEFLYILEDGTVYIIIGLIVNILLVLLGIFVCATIAKLRGSPYYVAWGAVGLLGITGIIVTLIGCPNRYVIIVSEKGTSQKTNTSLPKTEVPKKDSQQKTNILPQENSDDSTKVGPSKLIEGLTSKTVTPDDIDILDKFLSK